MTGDTLLKVLAALAGPHRMRVVAALAEGPRANGPDRSATGKQ